MNNLLSQFWDWMPISYEEYAVNGISQLNGSYEDSFPLFSELLSYAELIIHSNLMDDEHIDDLLTILAIDNETEYVLDLIKSDSSNCQINRIVLCGVNHPLYHTRWQIAELIYHRKPSQHDFYLQKLSMDSHPYVKRRAMNCKRMLYESRED